MKENIIFGILVIVIAFICSATVLTSPEKVVDVDEEYIYTEKYSLFNRDTKMHKYSKPICSYAICVNKNKFRTYNAAAKTSTLFKQVTILYNKQVQKDTTSLVLCMNGLLKIVLFSLVFNIIPDYFFAYLSYC